MLMLSQSWIRQQHREATKTAPPIPAICTEPLGRFIPGISPHYGTPEHLREILDLFDRIDRGEEVRALISVPPRHGKSDTIIHGLARLIARQRKGERNAYATYAQSFARGQSRKVRNLILELGLELDQETNRQEEWETKHCGGLFATGIGGPLTGKGIDGLLVVDDPFKSRDDAASASQRDRVFTWFGEVCETRLEGNASIIVVHTRWHVDDLIGRLLKTEGWDHINIPAVTTDELGERHALLPTYPGGKRAWPLDKLDRWRAQNGDYSWFALFMGHPRPKGGALFGAPTLTTLANVPDEGTVAIGVDLAYTAKTYSDYCVAVVLRKTTVLTDEGRQTKVYVERVVRKQEKAEVFIDKMRALSAQYPGAPIVFHGSSAEVGAADVIKKLGLDRLSAKQATGDKYVRAQEVAAAWDRGEIYVPKDAGWSQPFLSEIGDFTGVGDRFDDQVDALASAYSALPSADAKSLETRGRRRTSGLGRSY